MRSEVGASVAIYLISWVFLKLYVTYLFLAILLDSFTTPESKEEARNKTKLKKIMKIK
jgi:hypothetical protein